MSAKNTTTAAAVNSTDSSDKDNGKGPSKFVGAIRKVYHPLGFSKGYNFVLFFIFGGAMLGFCLARLSYLNISGSAPSSFKNGALPGEWHNYTPGRYRIGISIHLITIIPAGLLMVFQFVPVIRHKLIIFHRINGYLIILLVCIANVGAVMIAPRAFGGTIVTQTIVWVLFFITTTAIIMAYINIKRLQIEQHRAWMLRAMFYLGVIITMRIVMIITALIVGQVGGFVQVQTCGQIASMHDDSYEDVTPLYPACFNGTDLTKVVVEANFNGVGVENVSAALTSSAGMALWFCLLLHLVGVEIYLALTPKEAERLRQVSYTRQLEAGYAHPGSAGLTSDRLGDAEKWRPTSTSVEI